MTVAGDVGSGSGTEPMVKYGEKPLRRKNKKAENKMKSFRDLVKVEESPVGKVGRTKDSEAAEHIENSSLAKEFRKIVKKLGGKNVARQLLAGMKQNGSKVKEGGEGTGSVDEAKTMNPTTFLIELGYKIKDEKYEKHSFELEFYNAKDAKDAYKELTDEGFLDYYNMTSAGKLIGFENI